MISSFWQSWGISVIGPSHKRIGQPNQDAWIARRYKWGSIIVVSDGLGSKKHSDTGSKAACQAVCDAAKAFFPSKGSKLIDLCRLIHAYWLIRIYPYDVTDCGATCLFVVQVGDSFTLGRLGDGMIAVAGESDDTCFILSDNKDDSFSNLTCSLHNEFRPNDWECISITNPLINAIALCSDGISDDIILTMRIPFVNDLYKSYSGMQGRKRTLDIRKWLECWPVPGHSDDKTLACLFKRRSPHELNI